MLLEKIYGRCLVTNKISGASSQVIESTALLKLQQQKQKQELKEPGMTPKKDGDATPKKETPEKMDTSGDSRSSLLVPPGTPYKVIHC